MGNDSATFVGNLRDTAKNTETSSFFGASTFGGAVKNIISGMCRSRPWALGIIASIIPVSFFDNLCAQGGFGVGASATNTSNVPIQGYVETQGSSRGGATRPPIIVRATSTPPKPLATSTTPLLPPRVDIWAVPSSVTLGARTTIFWNTENVSHCTETSPDGSFNQTSLSGGSATVPLTAPTIFTISCLAQDGKPATAYVTVKIGH
jgi:hypothetical protein